MKLGTKVKLSDGRIGTVVYNSLDGVGIKWGEHNPDPKDFEGTHGGLFESETVPEDFKWYPDAMLRNPYPSATLPCVGTEYEVL